MSGRFAVKVIAIAAVTAVVIVIVGRRTGEIDKITKQQFSPPIPASEMDIKMEFLRKWGNTNHIPDLETLQSYDLKQLSALWHSYLDNVHILCKRHLRMGNLGDGGYEVCDDVEWRPIRPCVVYSFGIRNDFSFDDDISNVYGCNVFSFDPAMPNTHRHSDKVMFYDIGIGEKTEDVKKNLKVKTLSDIKKMLNHSQDSVIDVLKIDIEENEWTSLKNLIAERQLVNVRQLLIEYHHIFYAKEETVATFRDRLATLRALQEIGFRTFYANKYTFRNPCARKSAAFPVCRPYCYEVHYVNVNFKRKV